MTTILRRLLGVVLVLTGVAALVVGGWFVRALGTDGAATFTSQPQPGVPVVVDAQTNARTDIPLVITATAADDVPITVSIASPSDAEALLGDSRHERVTGVEVRDWVLTTERIGGGDPITPATADLWRSQTTTDGTAEIAGDLETAPETMIITTPQDSRLTALSMTWSNPAWFYQALALAFAGLLLALVGVGLVLKRGSAKQDDAQPVLPESQPESQPDAQPRPAADPSATPTEEVTR